MKKNKNPISNNVELNSFDTLFINIMSFYIEFKTILAIFFANLFIYLLFIKNPELSGINTTILFYLFLFSLFVLKTGYYFSFGNFILFILKKICYIICYPIIWLYRKCMKIKPKKSTKKSIIDKLIEFKDDYQSPVKDLRNLKKTKFIIYSLKGFYFTLLELLFPIIMIWILFYIYIIIRYTQDINLLNNNFIGILTLFGIIISIFQFYLTKVNNEKNSLFKIISNDVKEKFSETIMLNIILKKFGSKFSKYKKIVQQEFEITKPKHIDKIPQHCRKEVLVVNKYNNNIFEFFDYIENDIKELKDENKKKEYIQELNSVYLDYFREIKEKIIDEYKEDNPFGEKFVAEYVFNPSNKDNSEILKYYFEEKDKKINTDEKLIRFADKFKQVYLEVLITIMFNNLKKNE